MARLPRLARLWPVILQAALALGLASIARAEPKPDLVLGGQLTVSDLHTYREAPFDAPPGVKRLTVRFSQDGASQRTTIDLGLLDPNGLRGWSGGAKSGFTLSATDATPSYLPGPITPGRWRLLLGVPNIRPGVVTHYEARIWFDRTDAGQAASTFSDAPLKAGPGWYRGDLHDHTAHSDGSCASRTGKKAPCPVFLTVEAAERRGLDFLAVSDHNTVSQAETLRELQPYFDNLLLIPARELTTFQGHANALGGTAFIDFRLDGRHVRNADQLIAATHAAGALFSINHPGLPSGEDCMGCGWTAPVADPSKIDSVEVVNGGLLRMPLAVDGLGSGFAFWQGLLARGLHPTAVGGSDNHQGPAPTDARQGIGAPTTVVYARELSERAILEGIKAGHVFVDVEGSRDRLLEASLEAPGGRALMGDAATLPAGGRATLSLHVKAVPGGRVEWVHDAGVALEPAASGPLTDDDTRQAMLTAAAGRHWAYAKVRDGQGRLVLVGNPIYITAP
jgi:hypothetical protein